MNEYNALSPIVKTLIEIAKQNNFSKISKVTLAIAEKSDFDEGSLQLYFETLGAGTVLETAEITLRRTPNILQCTHCATVFVPAKQPSSNCPLCNNPAIQAEASTALCIQNVEGEKAKTGAPASER